MVARKLRGEHAFRGYIHLKTIPLAVGGLVAEAGRWADRLSVNIELPTQHDLDLLAPEKKQSDIEQSMGQVCDRVREAQSERRKSRNAPVFAPAGQSTQMVIGATPSTDGEILQTSSDLYDNFKLRRVYYSAFSPIPHADGRLPSAPGTVVTRASLVSSRLADAFSLVFRSARSSHRNRRT